MHHEAAAAAAAAVSTPRPDDRKRLPMVDACIREAQRLYPVAPFVVRHLRSDLRLKDGEDNRGCGNITLPTSLRGNP